MKKNATHLLIAILALFAISSRALAGQPIKGTVCYHENPNKPVPSVIVQLWQGEEFIAETTTNFNGKYIFPNVPSGNYTIKGKNTPIAPGGIEMDDYYLMEQFAFNLSIPSEIELLAADFDGDRQITTEDLDVWMLNWNSTFQPEWVFENVSINHDGTKTNVPVMGGSSSGDVNGTFVPTTRNEVVNNIAYLSKNLTKNFTIEVFAKDLSSASAMGMVINFPNTINIDEVISVQFSDFTNTRIENNQIIVTCFNNKFNDHSISSNEPVVIITGSINDNYTGGNIVLEVTNQSHFLKNGQVVRPSYSVTYLSETGSDNLSINYPNPAIESTTVYFNLPCDSKTTLNVFNQNGQLVKTVIDDSMKAGQHSVTFNVNDLKQGVYFYNLTTSGVITLNETKRLIVVK